MSQPVLAMVSYVGTTYTYTVDAVQHVATGISAREASILDRLVVAANPSAFLSAVTRFQG